MTLVERFTEIEGWTVARKTALLAGAITFPLLVLNLLVGLLLLDNYDWFDLAWYDAVCGTWALTTGLAGVVAWWVARRGHEGRWTYYFFAVPYGLCGVMFAYMLGTMSTPLFAALPMAGALVIVWMDDRIGRFVFWFVILATGALVAATAFDWFPYAPALDSGVKLERESSLAFTLTMGYLMIILSIAALTTVRLMVIAARQNAARLREAHIQLSRATEVIARYVPADLAEDILSGQATESDGYGRKKLTVFFSDLVGFSDIAEELEPEDLALVLNDYFSEMTAIAHRHHGTVDELQGDALLILFGALHRTTDQEHALDAVRMATEMHRALDALNARWRGAGITERLIVRMGINTGVVTVGHFGSPERMKYAALGKHVNIAARLQALCEPGRTVISYGTWLLVKDEIDCQPLGALPLKGITRPVDAYEVAQHQ